MTTWKETTLPKCFGWPALRLDIDGHSAWIWRSSPHTTHEEWCYFIDEGRVTVTQGNMGSVKNAARAALLRQISQSRAYT